MVRMQGAMEDHFKEVQDNLALHRDKLDFLKSQQDQQGVDANLLGQQQQQLQQQTHRLAQDTKTAFKTAFNTLGEEHSNREQRQ